MCEIFVFTEISAIPAVKSSQIVGLRDGVAIIRRAIKSSQVVGLRDRVAIIRALLQTNSSPHPYAGYGDLNGVGRRRNLSEDGLLP